MKNIILIFSILFYNSLVFSGVPGGDNIVHDPINKSVIVETNTAILDKMEKDVIQQINSIAQVRENVQKANEAIKQGSREIKNTVHDFHKSVDTIYNNTFGLVGEGARLWEEIQKIPDTMEKEAKSLINTSKCLVDSMDKYEQVETMYKAKYHFKGNDNSTPDNPNDDRYVFENGRDGAGTAYNEWAVNPCGHELSMYEQMVGNVLREKEIILRVGKKRAKTREELNKLKNANDELLRKVESTKSLKETQDVSKLLLWKILKVLENIEYSLDDMLYHVVSLTHDPSTLKRAKRLTKDQRIEDQNNNIKYGSVDHFRKKLKFWADLPKGAKTPALK